MIRAVHAPGAIHEFEQRQIIESAHLGERPVVAEPSSRTISGHAPPLARTRHSVYRLNGA
jgi:hypothetical protein